MTKILFGLPASLETYQGLGNFMYAHDITREMYEVVDEVIGAWMSAYEAAQAQRSAPRLDPC